MIAAAPLMGVLARLALLAACCWLATAIEMAPFRAANTIATPDLLFCLLAAVALVGGGARIVVLAFLFGLFRDLVSGGPVGPGALALTLSVELLRGGAATLARRSPPFRWLVVVAALAAGLALQATLLTLAFWPAPDLARFGARVASTALAFLPVMLAARLGASLASFGARS